MAWKSFLFLTPVLSCNRVLKESLNEFVIVGISVLVNYDE